MNCFDRTGQEGVGEMEKWNEGSDEVRPGNRGKQNGEKASSRIANPSRVEAERILEKVK